MKTIHNISAQTISWVKSNKEALEDNSNAISHLYYPETIDELIYLYDELTKSHEHFELIGYSSNTLFLPSYHIDHLICIRKVDSWRETESQIICECGVNVARLSKAMVNAGYVGFEGLTDLPGTIAGAVYGNCGCRGCSINALVDSVDLLTIDGIKCIQVSELKLAYRSSALKRKELDGIILRVFLRKTKGDVKELQTLAEKNHQYRKDFQPSGINNLGTTFNGGKCLTLKGWIIKKAERCVQILSHNNDTRKSFPMILRIIGKSCFVPYVYYWNRYMFIDARSHELFPKYEAFLKTMYKDVRFEIEIRK